MITVSGIIVVLIMSLSLSGSSSSSSRRCIHRRDRSRVHRHGDGDDHHRRDRVEQYRYDPRRVIIWNRVCVCVCSYMANHQNRDSLRLTR